ncbi:MAG TPA: dephospho-CoA kinase [Chitinophagaceae bacterium]|jgi:dephospho-CoA kinase|nr:dephospho-CoA kinase [Chitinophagaceae bacterium]
MIKVGLTGGIGSGKTTVAKLFEVLGIPVFYADDRTKLLMNTNPELKEAIIRNFGKDAYIHGELDRKYLAGIVFNDKEKLELLNSLTHPVTIQDAEEWFGRQTTPYVIKEAALLFESGAAEKLDYIVGVYAPQHIRVQRVMDRDKIPVEEIMKRISRQIDEEMKMKLCNFVIVNNEQQLVIPQVLSLHQQFTGNTTNPV